MPRWTRYGRCVLPALLLASCQAPRVDLPADASRAAGIANAIVLRDKAGAVDVPEVATPTLSLNDAVRRSLAHDPRIQAAMARVRVAQAEAQQSRLLPNPILNVSWRLPEGGGQAIFETSLTADLISILQQPRRISAADKRLRAACAEALTIVLDVMMEVQESYASAQSLDAEVAIVQQRGASCSNCSRLPKRG